MPARLLMDVDEYLRTSFEGPDCEYLDGEIVERNMGELPHARIQTRLVRLLDEQTRRVPLEVLVEIRIQIHPRRYRVADIAVWRAGPIGDRIPTVPPFLVVEILSPEDRMVRVQPKIGEYLSIGVEWIWVIDPEEKSALCYSQKDPAGAACDVLRTENPEMAMELEAVLGTAA